MDKKSFADVLGHYFKGDELERAKMMLEKSEKDFLEYESERITIQSTPQTLVACVVPRAHMSRSQEFLIADLLIKNTSSKVSEYQVDVELDKNQVLTSKGSLDGKESKMECIHCNGADLSRYGSRPVPYRISVRDVLGRDLAYVSGEIPIVSDLRKPKIVAELSAPGEGSNNVCGVVIRSEEKSTFVGSIKVKDSDTDRFVHLQQFMVLPEQSLDLTVDVGSLPESIDTFHPVITVECDGYQLNEVSCSIDVPVPDRSTPMVASTSKVFAECSGQRVIDTSLQKDGQVTMGELAIANEEGEAKPVSINVTIGGKPVFTKTQSIPARGKTSVKVTVPGTVLQRDDTYQADVRFTVSDEVGSVILDRLFSMIVRSRFDLDLTKLKEQSAAAVNPLDPTIQDFVDRSDGPLSKAMGPGYSVCGYQSESMIVPQIKAVFKAVQGLGMHYVSDTETFRDGHYQRVRTPSKVLDDHTGNCIEFSILFASILEAMSFEPVLVYPHGHAIVGVVVGTKAYPSGSKVPKDLKDRLLAIGNGSEKFLALCFESTMCANSRCTFEDAVKSAYGTISEQLSSINGRSSFSMIESERRRGVKPRID